MILETERLTLTPLSPSDGTLVYPMMSDPEVMAHWDIEAIEDPQEVDNVVAARVAAMEAKAGWYWTMRLTQTGDFLGCCDLSEIDRRHRRAEVGFMLHRDAWGSGYALEAMTAVLGHAATLGLKRLWARTHVGDIRSENLLTKLGFENEGYMHGHIDRDGERRDVRLWGVLL